MKKILLIAAYLLSTIVFTATVQAQDNKGTSWMKNGSTLYYKVTTPDKKYDFIAGDLKLDKDLAFSWSMSEPVKSKGKVFMASGAINEATSVINYFKDGTSQNLETETTVWLSRKVYKSLKSQTSTDISIDGTKETLKYAGTEKYTFTLDGEAVTIEVLKATTPTNNKLWILDNPEFPLIIKMELAFTIELVKVFTLK